MRPESIIKEVGASRVKEKEAADSVANTTSGTVSFAAGETSKEVVVQRVGDGLREGSATL
ncbi:hypothetical protein D5085_06165 [Ectothiorhodospiraceae bacterium BW-2]|nr:hypothetical protein D5085_06165 [Ectothiorhodospiraceae bacterium BW-2]